MLTHRGARRRRVGGAGQARPASLVALGVAATLVACGGAPPAPSASSLTATATVTVTPAEPSATDGVAAPFTIVLPDGWDEVQPTAAPSPGVRAFRALRGPTFNAIPTTVLITDSGGFDRSVADFKASFPSVRDHLQSSRGATDITEPVDIRVGGETGADYGYTVAGTGGKPVRVEQVVVAHAQHTYVATFTTIADHFDEQQPVFRQLLQSWKWKP